MTIRSRTVLDFAGRTYYNEAIDLAACRKRGKAMGRFLNPDNSAFQAALSAKIYVDKSELIAFTNSVLGSTDAFICNSRPRRFGKSITANMLTAYYSKGCDSREMFSHLRIGRDVSFEAHLNRYDVIHFDIQWCIEPAGGPEQIISFITEQVITELNAAYPKVLPEQVVSLSDALSCVHAALGKKFIVIIDEWDVLIRDEANNRKIQEEYINFLRGLFKGTEPTKYICMAYMTGILPIKKLKTQSALNNFEEYTMLTPKVFAPYIGFTEEEVRILCQRYHRDFSEVKHWYDGYRLGAYQAYNPRAVVNLMYWGEFQSYWSQTGSYESVLPLINMNFDGLKTAIIEMLSGAAVEVDVGTFQNDTVSFADKDDVLTYLIHLGYLGYDQMRRMAFIPNEEIRQEFQAALKRKKWNELTELELQSADLLEATLDMDAEAVAKKIDQIHTEYVSSLRYNDENSLSCVLTVAYLSSMQYYFKPKRELATGRGFADLVYLPKAEYRADYPALLVELKWNQSASTALTQIREKDYPESIREYTGKILLIGINYDKKTKVHQCKIEEYKKDE